MPNIALVGHNHTCPMVTGNVSHVGGPISSAGSSACTVNGIPVALVGDTCICAAGGPDSIISGTPALTINGIQVAMQGSGTSHGGKISQGDPALTVS